MKNLSVKKLPLGTPFAKPDKLFKPFVVTNQPSEQIYQDSRRQAFGKKDKEIDRRDRCDTYNIRKHRDKDNMQQKHKTRILAEESQYKAKRFKGDEHAEQQTDHHRCRAAEHPAQMKRVFWKISQSEPQRPIRGGGKQNRDDYPP